MESDVRPVMEGQPASPFDSTNDSASIQQTKSRRKSSVDTDTCRICRGDGSIEEPLFYPCKCNGSIKFVHQDCLMEWLSHSQKKHCELCKTPFRFTKLYSPQMPPTLPATVFLHKALSHVVKGFFTSCRGMLVAFVWLLWLPWSMRFVWWGLFWIGDGGWVYNARTQQSWSTGGYNSLPEHGLAQPPNSSLAYSSAPSHNSSTPFDSSYYHPLLKLIQMSKLLFGIMTGGQSLQSNSNDPTPHTNATMAANLTSSTDSLLSGISFFQNLTPSPVLNKIVTDVLEGQIITLSVVVAFILIFLIREWVVQQQPVIGLAAMVNADNNARRNDAEGERVVDDPETEEEQPVIEQASSSEGSTGNSDDLDLPPEDAERPVSFVLERIDELIGEDCAREVALRSLDGNIDGQDAELPRIEGLVESMEKSLANITEFVQNDYSDTPKYRDFIDKLKSDIVAYAVDVRRSLVALQDESSEALEKENSELLSMLLENAQMLNKAVIRCTPKSLRSDVLEPAEKTEQWIQIGLQMLSSRKDLEKSQRELEELKSEYTSKVKDLSDSVNEPVLPPIINEGDNSLMPQARPTMPKRSLSSFAAEIRRNLDESSGAFNSSNDVGHALYDADPHTASAGSSRSLQSVSPPNHTIPIIDKQDTRTFSESVKSAIDESIPSASDSAAGNSDNAHDGDSVARPVEPEPTLADPTRSELVAGDITADFTGGRSTDGLRTAEEDANSPTVGAPATVDIPQQARAPFLDRLWDWVWGDILPAEPDQDRENDDEHIVENVADEAPFVPFVDAQPQERVDNEANDHDFHAVNIGDNPMDADLPVDDLEPVDDVEDLEGIMELIGMQGPLAGLFQNAVFCAVLISATVTTAVWFPYLWGKIVLVFLANPVQLAIRVPWLLTSGVSNFAIDFFLFLGCTTLHWVDSLTRLILVPVEWFIPSLAGVSSWNAFGKAMASVSHSALVRIVELFTTSNEATAPDFYHLSLSSHAALYAIRSTITSVFLNFFVCLRIIYATATAGVHNLTSIPNPAAVVQWLSSAFIRAPHELAILVASAPEMMRSGQLIPSFGAKSLPPLLAEGRIPPWTTSDRVIAVVAGYAFFATTGALYLKAGSPITNSQRGKKIEAIIAEILQQAGGVLKVILIISIEMLVFPLYCGFLLDIATLPLFENASLASRFLFMLHSPWTSGFVHWFLGTCYMFHFALFVSMCRKIVRSGVLYFIRDPDDPTFHPVRDVLEKTISSQLRKIGFSALVYGALVIFCMGSVVWAVAYGLAGIFPIRWSSDTQVFEFPIDLLIYNTLTPIVIHLLRPSKGLHMIYDWWFRKCARVLRLSHFLFGEVREDEEGRRNEGNGENVEIDGRFVRAPASDQVRVPKGRSVFVEVDANDIRLDGQPDIPIETWETGEKYTKVYVPPWFRLRIALFVFCLWALTAAAGLGFTVAPLLLGRWVLRFAASPGSKINDIYTLSIGVAILGAAFYVASSYKACLEYLQSIFPAEQRTLASLRTGIRVFASRTLRFLYVYGSLTLLIPSLLALLLEFYLIMPLHAYVLLNESSHLSIRTAVPLTTPPTPSRAPHDHTIHFLQDWTLGLLYLRILIRLILWRPQTRPARALHAIISDNGWANPNAALATRCFILPCTTLAALALVVPAPLGWLFGRFLLAQTPSLLTLAPQADVAAAQALYRVNAVRFAYPAVLGVGVVVWLGGWCLRLVGLWKRRVRDEVYLIGERLHNFGESRPPPLQQQGRAGGGAVR